MKPIIGVLATNCEGTQGNYIQAVERAGGCIVCRHALSQCGNGGFCCCLCSCFAKGYQNFSWQKRSFLHEATAGVGKCKRLY